MADKQPLIQPDRGQDAISIHLVNRDGLGDWLKQLSTSQRAALEAQKFDGGGYQTAIVPDGDSWFAVGGVADPDSLSSWCMAKLAESLPAGTYRRAKGAPGPAVHGWQTAQYVFDRYKRPERPVGPRVLLTQDEWPGGRKGEGVCPCWWIYAARNAQETRRMDFPAARALFCNFFFFF